MRFQAAPRPEITTLVVKINFLIYLIHGYKIKSKIQQTGLRQNPNQEEDKNPPHSPFNKGGLKIFPPLKRGVRGDFEIKDISY